MTILDASNKLFGWFWEHDSFCWGDLISLLTVSENPDIDAAIVRMALQELTQQNFLTASTIPSSGHGYSGYSGAGKEVWVLRQPLQAFSQKVTVSGQLAKIISETVNEFCSQAGAKEDIVNPAQLTEKDLSKLLAIVLTLMKTIARKNLTAED